MLSGQKLAERICREQDRVAARMELLSEAQITELKSVMAIDFGEHFAMQSLQALACAQDLLSPEAAQICYNALGPIWSDSNYGWAPGVDLATQAVLTQLFAELLDWKIKLVRAGRIAR